MDFSGNPTREALRAFISTMVVNQKLVTDELVEERFADATAPGAQEAMASMGMSFWNPETAEDGMLWREAHQLRQHTLLTWGREDRVNPLDGAMVALKLIPKASLHVFPSCGHWAQIEAADEFREVATAFLARTWSERRRAHDDRHPQHGLRPGRQHRPRGVEEVRRQGARARRGARTGPGQPLLPHRRGLRPARRLPLRQGRAVLHRLGAGRPPGAPGGARAPAEGRRRVRGGHRRGARRAPGPGAGPVPRPVRQRLRAVPRHHLRVAAGRHAVRRHAS